MPRSKSKSKPRKKLARDWRIVPDSILLVKNIKGSVFDASESLRPNEWTMLNYCYPSDDDTHARAVAIINSYAFSAPVVYVEALP